MMGNPVFVDTMNSLGGNGVAMGFDQLINAHADRRRRRRGEQRAELRQRPALPLRQVLLDDRAPDDPGDPGVLEEDLGRLSKDDQALITKVAKEAQQEQRKLWYESEKKSLEEMKEAGVEIIDVDDKKRSRTP